MYTPRRILMAFIDICYFSCTALLEVQPAHVDYLTVLGLPLYLFCDYHIHN